jgi:hypothetical protein
MANTIFGGWHFDAKTALITAFVLPFLILLQAVVRKYVKLWGTYILEGIMYWLSRGFKRSLAGSLTLKRYCRLRLAEENRYLYVPSSLDIKLVLAVD